MKLTNEQKEIINCKNSMVIKAVAGSGKGLVPSTLVLTTKGYIPISQLTLNDMLISIDGKPTKILGIYPQTEKDIYKITFSNKISHRCDNDHLWDIQNSTERYQNKKFRTLNTEQLYQLPIYSKSYNKNKIYKRANIFLPTLKAPIEFNNDVSDLIIDPYILGVLIGDGHLSNEEDIRNKIKSKLSNNLNEYLKKLGLKVNSYKKFIPKEYLFSSVKNRQELLVGLIDTDGYCCGSSYEYSTTSEQLANDFIFLAESLGHVIKLTKIKNNYKIIIKCASFCQKIHSSTKHETNWKKGQSNSRIYITNIEKEKEKEKTICLKIDHPSELFIIQGGILTHNTKTLIEYAKAYPEKQFLYLAFNRSVKNEMIEKISNIDINNLTIETAHSFAYKKLNVSKRWKLFNDNGSIGTYNIIDIFDLKSENDFTDPTDELVMAQYILELYNYFFNIVDSDVNNIKNFNDESFYIENELTIKQYVKRMIQLMKENKIGITHDFYLKLFALTNPVLNFDCIMLDEAQDANPIMVKIIDSQPIQKIMVGDSYQQIYGFRNAINSMDKVSYQDFKLSNSFRFKSDIASLANKVLNFYIMLGKQIDLKVNGVSEREYKIETKATIARKNITLLEEALDILSYDYSRKLYFEGGYNGYIFASNGNIWDVYNLKLGNTTYIKNKFFLKLKTYDNFLKYIEKSNDYELMLLNRIVCKYGSRLPYLFKQLKDSITESKKDAYMIFSTVHKSKGLEYDEVTVTNDFINNESLKKLKIEDVKNETLEEINMLYVAVTRAKHKVILSDSYYF